RILLTPSADAAVAPLKPGDGVVFDAADWRSPQLTEEGGRVYQVSPDRGGQLEVQFGNGALDFSRIRPGDWLWRTHDPGLDKVVQPFIEPASPRRKQPLAVQVWAHEGEPLRLTWTLPARPGLAVSVQSDEPLVAAQERALTEEYLQAQLGRLGQTPFTLAELRLDVQGNPFAPSSLLNQLRRQAVEQLSERLSQPRVPEIHDPQVMLAAALAQIAPAPALNLAPQLHLLVRTPEQLDAALTLRPASITLDYLDLYGLRPAVERVQVAGITARVASPRVLKPNEQRIVNFLLRLECAILVRSTGLLMALQEVAHPPLIGDFSLNAANVLTADIFLRAGLQRLTPTHDLNAAQVAALARGIGADKIEVIAYQHLPVFHTEHCVFCRFLSSGASYKDCGHPCEKHRVALRDVAGRSHAVMADVGCRNTVFGAEAQEASQHLESWRQADIQHWRLEFVHETADQVTRIAAAFNASLTGAASAFDLNRQLAHLAPQGATQGSLFIPDDYLSLPLLYSRKSAGRRDALFLQLAVDHFFELRHRYRAQHPFIVDEHRGR
ncbi:MAG: DUF3656 domain-containing protein, partial [Anaerolineae bacterium]